MQVPMQARQGAGCWASCLAQAVQRLPFLLLPPLQQACLAAAVSADTAGRPLACRRVVQPAMGCSCRLHCSTCRAMQPPLCSQWSSSCSSSRRSTSNRALPPLLQLLQLLVVVVAMRGRPTAAVQPVCLLGLQAQLHCMTISCSTC